MTLNGYKIEFLEICVVELLTHPLGAPCVSWAFMYNSPSPVNNLTMSVPIAAPANANSRRARRPNTVEGSKQR